MTPSDVLRNAGRYELLRQVGHGGMATVYLARQTDLDRFVALKELRLNTSDPSLASRFLREARTAGGLSHPNIVTVHEHFQFEGTPYIAMEYLERGSLRPYIGRLTPPQFIGVLEGLLAGLDHAAHEGIVHRDLKPENVMITREGRAKIADFGIARARNRLQTHTFVTMAGSTVGTPTYMAPEQAMAKEIGPYTDLYSLGVIAWEMLIGRPPFHDVDTPVAILMRHMNDEIPSASSVDPTVDPNLSAWVDRLLVKDWRQRTPSAGQAWDELEDLVISMLGSRWRRDARLPEVPAHGGGDRPLTPADFYPSEELSSVEGGPEFASFVFPAAPDDPAAPPAGPSATSLSLDVVEGIDLSEPLPVELPGTAAEDAPVPPAPSARPAGYKTFNEIDAVPSAEEPEAPASNGAAPEAASARPALAAPLPENAMTVPPVSVPRVPAPAASGREARTRSDASPRRRSMLLGAIGVGAIGAGIAAGVVTGGNAPKAKLGPVVRGASASVRLPVGWGKAPVAELPIRMVGTVAAGPPGARDAALVVGRIADPVGPGLLPASAAKSVKGGRVPDAVRVQLGPGISALRYQGLTVNGRTGTAYVVPIQSGTVAVLCVDEVLSARACGAAAASVRLPSGVVPLELGADPVTARALARVLNDLERRAGPARYALRTARTVPRQIKQAVRVADAYSAAAQRLGSLQLQPDQMTALMPLMQAIGATAQSYASFASAVATGRKQPRTDAAAQVRKAAKQLATARAALVEAGYGVQDR